MSGGLLRTVGPLRAVIGNTSPDIASVYTRANALARDGDDPGLIFPVLYGQWAYKISEANIPGALEAADRFLQIAEATGDPGPRLAGHRIRGACLYHLGHARAALSEFTQALALFDAERNEALTYEYGYDQQVAALALLSLMQWSLGYPDQAVEAVSRAVDLARGRGDANTLGFALAWGLPVFHLLENC
jgi:tetratricopeptide (TPR) repeat protein